MAGAQQVFRHGAAHDATADESDFHDAIPLTTTSQNGSVTNPASVDQPMMRPARRVSSPKRSVSAMTITMVGMAASRTLAWPGSVSGDRKSTRLNSSH